MSIPLEAEKKTYEGNCHCKAIKYSINLSSELEEQFPTNCNCLALLI